MIDEIRSLFAKRYLWGWAVLVRGELSCRISHTATGAAHHVTPCRSPSCSRCTTPARCRSKSENRSSQRSAPIRTWPSKTHRVGEQLLARRHHRSWTHASMKASSTAGEGSRHAHEDKYRLMPVKTSTVPPGCASCGPRPSQRGAAAPEKPAIFLLDLAGSLRVGYPYWSRRHLTPS